MKTLLIVFIVLFCAHHASAQLQLDQKKVDAIESLVSTGLLKFDYELDKAWVSPAVWDGYNVDGKAAFTEYCALYIRYKTKNRDQQASVDLFDYKSGKKIAQYGWLGFKIID
ncbi:hypothetical protein [Algoriphagus formosus]|uniref:hypothetical protein n=1 Tax=Algoriphagus formosus TaxID=2007308 RepID=UPI003F6EED05